MSPRIFTNTFIRRPQFFTDSFVLTRVWDTGWLAVFDNLGKMDGHVAVDV